MMLFTVAIDVNNSATELNVDEIPAAGVTFPFSAAIKCVREGTLHKQKDWRMEIFMSIFLRFA